MNDLSGKTMTVVEISEPGGPEVLKPAQRAIPQPGAGEVLIKLAAAGVNRPDCIQRAGLYPAPPGASDLPGLEGSGTIAAVGEDVNQWAVGDEVCALLPGGGYAEYCTTPAAHCLPVPKGFDMISAAALPETFFTVWHNVFERGALKEGESFLVHGGAGGIGTTAIQLAKAFGATVFTTVGSAEKAQACLDLGADRAIQYKDEDFVDVIKEATGKKGVNVILDMVGGDYTPRNIKAMAEDGRLVQIAFLRGPQVELNMMPVMMKRLTITGSTLRVRTDEIKAGIAAALLENVWPMLEAGKVKPLIDKVLPLADAAEAHRMMEANELVGKAILTIG